MMRVTKVMVFGVAAGALAVLGARGAQAQGETERPEPATEPETRPSEQPQGAQQDRQAQPQGAQQDRQAQPQGAQQNGQQAQPRAQQDRTAMMAEAVTTTATVQSVDKSKRTVAFRGNRGQTVTVQVPEGMAGFEKLKKGDRVEVTYYESIAVSLMPPGEGRPQAEVQEGARQTGPGAGAMGRQVTVTAEVTKVDPKENTVTFRGPEGQTRTVSVKDPQLQSRLRELKPGQDVQVVYTEAAAVSIEPAGR